MWIYESDAIDSDDVSRRDFRNRVPKYAKFSWGNATPRTSEWVWVCGSEKSSALDLASAVCALRPLVAGMPAVHYYFSDLCQCLRHHNRAAFRGAPPNLRVCVCIMWVWVGGESRKKLRCRAQCQRIWSAPKCGSRAVPLLHRQWQRCQLVDVFSILLIAKWVLKTVLKVAWIFLKRQIANPQHVRHRSDVSP